MPYGLQGQVYTSPCCRDINCQTSRLCQAVKKQQLGLNWLFVSQVSTVSLKVIDRGDM